MQDWSELYPDFKTVMHGDIEMRLSHKTRLRDLPPITAAEVEAFAPAKPSLQAPAERASA